jgi:FxsC-like protein
MGDCYFLSYARIDLDEDPNGCVRRFYDDLDQQVRRRLVLKGKCGGFFDSQSTQLGERWPDALGNALRTSRAFISLYSRGYFSSEYCGKEWAVFHSRAQSFEASQKKAPLLFLPILFDPPEDLQPLPPALAKIQYIQDDYPEDYRENGLRYIMVRESKKDIYQNFLDILVRRLLRVIETWKLPELAELPDLTEVTSAFHAPPPQPGKDPNALCAEGAGPNCVDFVYVAARRSEVQPIKTRIEAYGEDGGMDWKPYWPELPDEIALLAQEVATKERFLCQPVSLISDLPMRIREAQKKKRIVVLLADTWTLRLPFYREMMRKYDELEFWNSCVLIAWNQKDEDTAVHHDTLREAVRVAFINKSRSRDERRFIDGVDSPESLRKYLGVALQKIKLEIIEISEDLRRIETGEVFHKPEIPVPA